MAALANLSGKAADARRFLKEYLPLKDIGIKHATHEDIKLLLEEAPTRVALSNTVMLLELLDDQSDESTSPLLALYDQRLKSFFSAAAQPQPQELPQ